MCYSIRIPWHPISTLNGLGDNDFNTFVRNVIRIRPGYVTELYSSFVKPGISYVGQTESLADDLIIVLKHLCLPFDAKAVKKTFKLNVSPVPATKLKWDEELRQTVMRLELPALVYFDYLTNDEKIDLGLEDGIEPCNAMQRVLNSQN